eukprot:3507415-Alexandrium_andersonii.AAC.1
MLAAGAQCRPKPRAAPMGHTRPRGTNRVPGTPSPGSRCRPGRVRWAARDAVRGLCQNGYGARAG